MKVKILRAFGDHKEGDTVEVDEARANYWQRVGVAEAPKGAKEKKEVAPEKEKASETTATKKADDTTATKKASDTKPTPKAKDITTGTVKKAPAKKKAK